jgi:hypothetical protein
MPVTAPVMRSRPKRLALIKALIVARRPTLRSVIKMQLILAARLSILSIAGPHGSM